MLDEFMPRFGQVRKFPARRGSKRRLRYGIVRDRLGPEILIIKDAVYFCRRELRGAQCHCEAVRAEKRTMLVEEIFDLSARDDPIDIRRLDEQARGGVSYAGPDCGEKADWVRYVLDRVARQHQGGLPLEAGDCVLVEIFAKDANARVKICGRCPKRWIETHGASQTVADMRGKRLQEYALSATDLDQVYRSVIADRVHDL